MGYLSELATRPINWEEAIKIMDANRDDKQTYCLLCIGFNTAMRLREIVNLTFEDVDGKDRITFREKRGKLRTVKLNERAREAISAWVEEYKGRMYYDPEMRLIHALHGKYDRYKATDAKSIYRMIQKAVDRTDVKVYKCTAHFMRKTFAAAIYKKLGSTDHALRVVSGILGHKKKETTMIYIGLEDEVFDHCYDLLCS